MKAKVDPKARSLRLIRLGVLVSAGSDLSQDERNEIHEALEEFAKILAPSGPMTSKNPDDFFAALDFKCGDDAGKPVAGKVVAEKWKYSSYVAFRKVVERNGPECDRIIKAHGLEKCRVLVSSYRDRAELIRKQVLDPGARRALLSGFQVMARIGQL